MEGGNDGGKWQGGGGERIGHSEGVDGERVHNEKARAASSSS